MAKPKQSKEETKPLNAEEVAKHKVVDQAAQMQQILGFGLKSAYDLGVEGGAKVADVTNPTTKAANVDALPEQKKK